MDNYNTKYDKNFQNKTAVFQLDDIPSKPIPPSKTADIQDINAQINTLTKYDAKIELLTNLQMEKNQSGHHEWNQQVQIEPNYGRILCMDGLSPR